MTATMTQAGLRTTTISKASWRALAASWLGWMFDGYETYALVLVMGDAVRHLVPTEQLSRLPVYAGGLLSVTLLGWATGGIIAGVLADYVGRKRMLMASILWYAVAAGLTALSPNYRLMLFFRFLTGLGLGAEWGPGTAMVAELWPPRLRGRAAAVLHAALGVGFFLAPAVWVLVRPFGPSAWRLMFVIGILPAFLLLYIRRKVQDPALWLAANEQRRQARRRIRIGVALTAEDRQLNRFPMFLVLSDTALRRRLGLLLLMSLSSAVGWWSVSTWIPQYAGELAAKGGADASHWSSLTALLYNAGGVAGYLVFGILADAYGRKPMIGCYYVGALTSSLWVFLMVRDPSTLLVAAVANGFFTTGQFAWMTIYLPEVFPTPVRGSATSLVYDSSRYVAALGPLVAGTLIARFGGISIAAALISLIYVLGLVVTPFAARETRGQPLPA